MSELVLGIDSSTQSTKALLVDAETGRVVEQRTARHPDGSTVDPRRWLDAVDEAAGPLLDRAAAVAVGGQQHGMVALDEHDEPVHDALLWNDTRSAPQAATLVDELGGPQAVADLTGSVYLASYTVTKLRWLRDHEPEAAGRVRRVLLPHDYVSWHLGGRAHEPATDRGDASGTGYFATRDGHWLRDVAAEALGHVPELPHVAGTHDRVGSTATGAAIAPGTGDNMAAALGLAAREGDVVLSIGTSGVASSVTARPAADPSGLVSGFADATGRFLPLACTLNAARVLDTAARLLGVDHDGLARLALAGRPGSGGLVLLPYLDGERTPDRPDASGTVAGLTTSTTREDLARAAVEGLLCSLADAADHLAAATGTAARRVMLVGGGAANEAVRRLAPTVLGVPVLVPPPGEYVALGAARQAAWCLAGTDEPPVWAASEAETFSGDALPEVRAAYAAVRDRTESWT